MNPTLCDGQREGPRLKPQPRRLSLCTRSRSLSQLRDTNPLSAERSVDGEKTLLPVQRKSREHTEYAPFPVDALPGNQQIQSPNTGPSEAVRAALLKNTSTVVVVVVVVEGGITHAPHSCSPCLSEELNPGASAL